MKKKILFLFFGLSFLCVKAQFIELIIKDKMLNENVSFGTVLNTYNNETTLSNKEGRLKLLVSDDTFIISHMLYKSKKIITKKYNNYDTIFLEPKVKLLDEITIYNIDIKKKLKYVLDNYKKLYYNRSSTYQGTYKETYKVNDSLTRLFQTNIYWWKKNSYYDFNKSFKKQCFIDIGSIDYSKRKEEKSFYGGWGRGRIIFSDIYKSFHLNYLIAIILNLATDINIEKVEKTKGTTEIKFNSPVISSKEKDITGDVKVRVILDNKTDAILFIDMTYVSNEKHRQKGLSRKEKIPFIVTNQNIRRTLTFNKNNNDDLVLSHSRFDETSKLQTLNDNKEYNLESHYDLFVTNIERGKNINKSLKIDLSKPFHENLPKMQERKKSKILLTSEELQFINE